MADLSRVCRLPHAGLAGTRPRIRQPGGG